MVCGSTAQTCEQSPASALYFGARTTFSVERSQIGSDPCLHSTRAVVGINDRVKFKITVNLLDRGLGLWFRSKLGQIYLKNWATAVDWGCRHSSIGGGMTSTDTSPRTSTHTHAHTHAHSYTVAHTRTRAPPHARIHTPVPSKS